MSILDAASDDGSLDNAVSAILGKLQVGDEQARVDTRENREDADVTELEESTDLDEAERQEREAAANADKDKNGKAPAEVEGKDAKDGEAEDDADFIELPATEEGGEPTRIPLAEAVEAVQKLRQMDGDIATAVIRAEEEAFTKQDQVLQAMNKTFTAVANEARAALQVMHAYAPMPPDPIMLDRNAGYYDPEGYHTAKIHYDNFIAHYQKVKATLTQAEQGGGATKQYDDSEVVRRETDRAARFIPEFKDEKAREGRKSEILDVLSKRYGVTKEELDDIVDHKAWRMMNDLTKMVAAEKKAPEVRKQIQETKPKLRNGRVPPERDPQNGRFLDAASKELRETGSEDAFVKKLMRSGALKGF